MNISTKKFKFDISDGEWGSRDKIIELMAPNTNVALILLATQYEDLSKVNTIYINVEEKED